MDSELKQDLLEAFEGLDPLELLSNDPTVASLVQEIENDPNVLTAYQKSILVTESVTSPSALKSDPEKNLELGPLDVKVKPPGYRSSKNGPCLICKGPSKGNKYYWCNSLCQLQGFLLQVLQR